MSLLGKKSFNLYARVNKKIKINFLSNYKIIFILLLIAYTFVAWFPFYYHFMIN